MEQFSRVSFSEWPTNVARIVRKVAVNIFHKTGKTGRRKDKSIR